MPPDPSLGGSLFVGELGHFLVGVDTSYGAPKQITVDNGPEFAGQVLDAWAYLHGVTLDFIEPGKPTQNAHIESFNGKFRDECLDLHWFGSLAHARAVIHAWKEEYNTQRPHSALRWRTPVAFAESIAT